MNRVLRCILRLVVNVCVVPDLRIGLLRLSGIRIGRDSFINMNVTFIDNYRGNAIGVGERVAIAPYAILISDSAPNNSRLKSIGAFCIRGQVNIGDDAWIGAGAVILPNVRIGKCAVIGAGSVVTKNVDDYAIMAGNPARKIGDIRDKPQGQEMQY